MLAVEINVNGRIDEEWEAWLGGLKLSRSEPDQTILAGVLPDHAAVYGVIARLRDLGLEFSSLRIEAIEKDNV
jgi:hypothetical protein